MLKNVKLKSINAFNTTFDINLSLTSKESDLLKMLCQYLNETLNWSITLKTTWKENSYFNGRSMDAYITKLRKLLKPDPDIKILTIHEQGFSLVKLK